MSITRGLFRTLSNILNGVLTTFLLLARLQVKNKLNLVYIFRAGNCLLKVNNRITRTRCEICFKLTTKTLERQHWCRSGVFIVKVEHISHVVLLFLLLTLNI